MQTVITLRELPIELAAAVPLTGKTFEEVISDGLAYLEALKTAEKWDKIDFHRPQNKYRESEKRGRQIQIPKKVSAIINKSLMGSRKRLGAKVVKSDEVIMIISLGVSYNERLVMLPSDKRFEIESLAKQLFDKLENTNL